MFHKYDILIYNLMGATLPSIIGLFDGSPMRGLAVGLRVGTSGVGIALGPVIGGILLQRFAWDGVFWVCAVIGIMGSLQAGTYTTGLTDAPRGSYLPQDILGASKESVMAAESISGSLPGTLRRLLDDSVASATMTLT